MTTCKITEVKTKNSAYYRVEYRNWKTLFTWVYDDIYFSLDEAKKVVSRIKAGKLKENIVFYG